MTAAQRIHPVNTTFEISRPESFYADKEAAGISEKEIQEDIRGDSAAVQVPQTVTEKELEKEARSQTEASIAV
jgi:hypothetical protein